MPIKLRRNLSGRLRRVPRTGGERRRGEGRELFAEPLGQLYRAATRKAAAAMAQTKSKRQRAKGRGRGQSWSCTTQGIHFYAANRRTQREDSCFLCCLCSCRFVEACHEIYSLEVNWASFMGGPKLQLRQQGGIEVYQAKVNLKWTLWPRRK